MKHLRKLILASAMTVTGFASAFAGGNSYGGLLENTAQLQQRVQNMIQIPLPTHGALEGTVDFVFRLDEQGRLDILSVSGDHQNVVLQVKEDLDDVRVNADNSLIGKTYRMNFSYNSTQESGSAPQSH